MCEEKLKLSRTTANHKLFKPSCAFSVPACLLQFLKCFLRVDYTSCIFSVWWLHCSTAEASVCCYMAATASPICLQGVLIINKSDSNFPLPLLEEGYIVREKKRRKGRKERKRECKGWTNCPSLVCILFMYVTYTTDTDIPPQTLVKFWHDVDMTVHRSLSFSSKNRWGSKSVDDTLVSHTTHIGNVATLMCYGCQNVQPCRECV